MPATDAAGEPETPDIPDKLYFRIGEVSQLLGVKPHVLRYWEREFPRIAPKKSGSGHRLFRRKDVELILEIKRLLYEERFTIEGARKFLGQHSKRARARPVRPPNQAELFGPPSDAMEVVRKELTEILNLLR